MQNLEIPLISRSGIGHELIRKGAGQECWHEPGKASKQAYVLAELSVSLYWNKL